MKSVSVVLWKRHKNDRYGVLRLRVIDDRKASYKSLGIKVLTTHWNERSQRVRKIEGTDYEQINQRIEEKLAELGTVDNVAAKVSGSKDSFLEYAEHYITTITTYGSRVKYEVVLNKLKKYRSQVLFADLTPSFIRRLHAHLADSLSQNTANHYMKLYQHLVNMAIREQQYSYTVHPFLTIKYKKERRQTECMTEDELAALVRVEVPQRLLHARRVFLFQLFAAGMRVSDVLLLQWSNVSGYYLSYRMFKTGKFMQVFLNSNMRILLAEHTGSKREPRGFIFDFLDAEKFPAAISSSLVSEEQYKLMHHAKVVYNRHLKELQALAGIKTNLTAHIPRHTYTNLLLTDRGSYDVYDISRSLGHSSLQVTEKYISTFNRERGNHISKQISDRFSLGVIR
ncbi:site-specific integrase [Hymenobacter sp. YC55]|uniref:site-specific integrase n=1 Tax=Hymenobacter sp. YC55 TaxID=3034019 RepID=UPI0023F83C4A|nr:site-specific integrase [Hymenobacter sp. YC55]MDF7812849.1 site-specific integrase [Hymenobacter sp. YC55]